MRESRSLFINSMTVRYLSIRQYRLSDFWKLEAKSLQHTVLWYVLDGVFVCTVGDQSYKAGSGCIIIIPPYMTFSCRANTEKVSLYSLNFKVDIPFLHDKFWNEGFRIPYYQSHPSSDILPLLHDMLDHSEHQSFTAPLLLDAMLLQLMATLIEHTTPERPNSTLHHPDIMDKRLIGIIEYLSVHPNEMLTISDMCKLAVISEAHLRRLFLKYTGLPPMSFMHRHKMELAKRSLSETDERISVVSHRLGYEDANYFSRMFKQHTGFTPSLYRLKNQILTSL